MKLDNLNHHLELERKRIEAISLYPGYEKYLARKNIQDTKNVQDMKNMLARKEIFKMEDDKDEL